MLQSLMRETSESAKMDFSFNAKSLRALLHSAVADNISELTQSAPDTDSEENPEQLLAGLEKAIDVMERADADAAARPDKAFLSEAELSGIGDFAMSRLEAIVERIENSSGHQNRDLARLSIPIALWVARSGGQINRLELVVNSFAAWANELQDTVQIAELARVVREIIDAASDKIRRDLDQSNPMRPWRIINLNYGIVATRSHDPELMDEAFAVLVENLPQDARAFFREGMQQMDIVGYPDEVREVVERYDRMWGSGNTLH